MACLMCLCLVPLAAQMPKIHMVPWWKTWVPHTFYGNHMFSAFSAARDRLYIKALKKKHFFPPSLVMPPYGYPFCIHLSEHIYSWQCSERPLAADGIVNTNIAFKTLKWCIKYPTTITMCVTPAQLYSILQWSELSWWSEVPHLAHSHCFM